MRARPVGSRHSLGVRARWAVPAGAVAGVGIIIAATAVATADAAPDLPPRTAQQLLTEVAQSASKPIGPFTATVQRTANFGLPQLPAIVQQQGGSSPLTAGTQSVTIWYGGPQHIRVAAQTSGGESDLRLDGRVLWLWNSKTQTATRYVLPAQASGTKIKAGNGSLRRLRPSAKGSSLGQMVAGTPQAAARQILSAVGPTTVVSVQRNVYVAGQAAYQLSLVPRSSKSLVGQVLVAIDASRHILLRVEVFPRGSSDVAYSLGYTALSFGPPAASNFSFTPPPGATVHTETLPTNLRPGLGGLGGLSRLVGLGIPGLSLGALSPTPVGFSVPAGVTIHSALSPGQMGTAVRTKLKAPQAAPGTLQFAPLRGKAPSKAVIARIKAQFVKSLPKSMTAAERAKAIAGFDKHFSRLVASAQLKSGAGSTPTIFKLARQRPFVGLPGQSKVKTIGTGWLTVIATPPSAEVVQALKLALAGQPTVAPSSGGYSSSYSVIVSSSAPGAVVSSSGPTVVAPGADFAVLRALLKAATPVHGTWGSGRLLQTRLLNVLITSKGQILAGAVTPAVLYADVALDAS